MIKYFVLIISLLVFTNSINSDSQKVSQYLQGQSFQQPLQATARLFHIADDLNFNAVMIDLFNAYADANVHAILLMIDNSGGNAARFGMLHDLIKKIINVKPVIALVTGVALSGGYAIASACNHIMVGNCSMLGSVGVISEVWKYQNPTVNLDGVSAQLNVELFQAGDFKTVYNCYKELSAKDKKYIQDEVEKSYKQFIGMVARNRSLKAEDHKKWADGKVFDAEEALKLGLIDSIGTMIDAESKVLEIIGKRNPSIIFDKKLYYKND